MSTTKTRVSVPLIPADDEPDFPYPSAGGTTSSTWLPTRLPTRPSSHPLMTCPTPIWKPAGVPFFHVELKTLPVRQITPSYWAMSSWPFFTTDPVPWMRVWTCSLDDGAVLGIRTGGALPADAVPTVGSPVPVTVSGVPCALAVFW